jgi:hypothetical protein
LTAGKSETFLKSDFDGKSLTEVGLKDGGVLRVAALSKTWSSAKQAQRRVERGITRVASSLDAGFKAIGGKVDAVDDKATAILGILCGEPAPIPVGQSNKESLKSMRLGKNILEANIREVREKEEKRIADEKRGRAAKVTEAAEMAEGGVDLIVGELDGQSLKEKLEKHKAQGKVLQQAARKEKTKERKAIAMGKAAAKPKARRGKKRARAEHGAGLLPADQDEGEEKLFDIEAEVDKLGDDDEAAPGAAASSSNAALAPVAASQLS